jgi:hypothetical protein
VAQVAEIGSADEAALWAYRNMRAKNGLTTADARQVEEAFRGKLAGFAGPQERLSSEGRDVLPRAGSVIHKPAESQGETTASNPRPAALSLTSVDAKPSDRPLRSKARAGRSKSAAAIDKAALAFPEPRRIRDREHVRFVAKQPCLACGRTPSDPHHPRFAQSRALGRKVSDEFTVPLCRGHHREVHRSGDKAAWWRKASIDPTVAARTLWLETHPLPPGGAGDRRPLVETRGEARRYETKPIGAADNP